MGCRHPSSVSDGKQGGVWGGDAPAGHRARRRGVGAAGLGGEAETPNPNQLFGGEPGVTGQTQLRSNWRSKPRSHRTQRDPSLPLTEGEDGVVRDTCHQGHPTGRGARPPGAHTLQPREQGWRSKRPASLRDLGLPDRLPGG